MALFSVKIIEKIKKAENVEELILLAKESGIELTTEQAAEQFSKLHSEQRELSDDELDNVAGGACVTTTAPTCPKCGSENVDFAGTQDYPMITCHDCGYSNRDSIV